MNRRLSLRDDVEEQLRSMWEEQDAIKSGKARFEAEMAAMDAAYDAESLAGLDSYNDDDPYYWSDMEYKREKARRDDRILDEIYYQDMLDRDMFDL